MIWKLKELLNHTSQNQTCINEKWIPARPINYKYRSLKERLRDSLAVFSGKAEAFKWPEGQ